MREAVVKLRSEMMPSDPTPIDAGEENTPAEADRQDEESIREGVIRDAISALLSDRAEFNAVRRQMLERHLEPSGIAVERRRLFQEAKNAVPSDQLRSFLVAAKIG